MQSLSIRLSILGLLMERNMHPYEIRTRMKERFLDLQGRFKIGSLYYAVDQLKKQNYIEAVMTVQDELGPEKTVYRITDSGKAYFQNLLLDRFREAAPDNHPLYIALVFAGKGDQEQIAMILRGRIGEAERHVELCHRTYAEHEGIVPRSVLHLMAGYYEHARTELAWLRRLLIDAEAGKLHEISTLPGFEN